MNPLNFVAVILKVLLVNLLAALNFANFFKLEKKRKKTWPRIKKNLKTFFTRLVNTTLPLTSLLSCLMSYRGGEVPLCHSEGRLSSVDCVFTSPRADQPARSTATLVPATTARAPAGPRRPAASRQRRYLYLYADGLQQAQRRNASIRGPRHFLKSGPLKLITKSSRTVESPLPPVGPPSLDAAATPSLVHWAGRAFNVHIQCSSNACPDDSWTS